MHDGYSRARTIPFWCSYVLTAFALTFTSACADRNEKAAENAASAQRALESNDLVAARRAIAEAVAERDDVLAYHMLRGRIELASGSASGAYDAYNEALALDATNGEALLAVAELGLTTGNLRESRDAVDRVLTLAPNQLDALLIRGIHSLIKRDYSEAIDFGNKILSLAPGHEGGTILKARAQFMSREPDEALETLDQISGDAASSEPASLTRLEIYRAMRRESDMANEFERLRSLRPKDLALRIDEANFRFKINDRRQAHQLVASVLASPEASVEQSGNAVAIWQEYGIIDLPQPAFSRIVTEGSVPARQSLARFFLRIERTDKAADLIAALPAAARDSLQARYLLQKGEFFTSVAPRRGDNRSRRDRLRRTYRGERRRPRAREAERRLAPRADRLGRMPRSSQCLACQCEGLSGTRAGERCNACFRAGARCEQAE